MFITGVLAAKMNGNGLGSSDSGLAANQTSVTFGTLSNTPYGSGYGYANGTMFGVVRTAGSNPLPTTVEIGGHTFNHPAVGEWTVFGNRQARVEIDWYDNGANHPQYNWLNLLTVANGAGISDTLCGGSISTWNLSYRFSDQWAKRGSMYTVYGGTGSFPFVFDMTNNAKVLTWDFN